MKRISLFLLVVIITTPPNTFAQTDVFDHLLFSFKCNSIDSIAYNQGGGVDIGTKIATLGDWNGDGMDELMWTKNFPVPMCKSVLGKVGRVMF